MKQIVILIVSFLMIPLLGFSQKKLIQEGLKNGKNYNHLYTATNNSNKVIKEENVYKYCRENKIIVKNLRTKLTNQFGGSALTVASFEFLPESEATDYVFFQAMGNEYQNCKSTGNGYYYSLFNGGSGIAKKVFTNSSNLKWSGTISNGTICGSGFGYYYNTSDGMLYCFKGRYDNGKPTGDVLFKRYKLNVGELTTNETGTVSLEIGEMSDDMAFVKKNGSFCMMNSKYEFVTDFIFAKIVKPFENGTAEVVKTGNYKEIVIDKLGNFVDYTNHQKKLDEEERIRKEREAELERQRLEREKQRQAKEEAERKRQQRIAEIDKELKLIEDNIISRCNEEVKRKYAVGKEVHWAETITYNIGNGDSGLLLGLLENALGTNRVSYEVHFFAIVESVIGTSTCKTIITRTQINDPAYASYNYAKYRNAAAQDVSKYIGQTRVKQLSEVELTSKIATSDIEAVALDFKQTAECQSMLAKMDELKAEKSNLLSQD